MATSKAVTGIETWSCRLHLSSHVLPTIRSNARRGFGYKRSHSSIDKPPRPFYFQKVNHCQLEVNYRQIEISDVSIVAILETKDRRIILVNGHIINVYRHTTSNQIK